MVDERSATAQADLSIFGVAGPSARLLPPGTDRDRIYRQILRGRSSLFRIPKSGRRRRTVFIAVLSLIVIADAAAVWVLYYPALPSGCPKYTPVDVPLVAHAGGGLPDRTYTNSLDAAKMARSHGFRWIEIDFIETPQGLRLGHAARKISATSVDDLLGWLATEPDVRIVTDFKTDNVRGLALLKAKAGRLQRQFIPQIYSPDEYSQVVGMGYPTPIFSVYRMGWFGWKVRSTSCRCGR